MPEHFLRIWWHTVGLANELTDQGSENRSHVVDRFQEEIVCQSIRIVALLIQLECLDNFTAAEIRFLS